MQGGFINISKIESDKHNSYNEKLTESLSKKKKDDLKKINRLLDKLNPERHNNDTVLSSYRFSDKNIDYYNYCLDDKYINQHFSNNVDLKMFTRTIAQNIINDKYFDNKKNVIQEKIFNDIQYENVQISTIYRNPDYVSACVKYTGEELISCNISNKTNTPTTVLIELNDINSNDYAYCTLFFPMYNNQFTQIKYNYLPPTLLVAYLLKSENHNISNLINGKTITGTKAKVVCMVTPDVDNTIIDILKVYYDDVITVPYIAWDNVHLPDDIKNDPTKFIKIGDVSKGSIQPEHAYNRVFTKLHIFDKQKFNYKKVILLDTDLFPMCYFDSLFSLDTPAGWLEHRRSKESQCSVTTWRYDRCDFIDNRNGGTIPKYLTDIENSVASDINASLYIITPNSDEYDSMITDLQEDNVKTWFKSDSYHKGFWLGNKFNDKYLLPEQNYLTKRFSGSWKSVDMSYCTWLINTDVSFGFTYAGWVIKPWINQSINHQYSRNMSSEWSKTHNDHNQKSYSMQVLNNLFCRMMVDLYKKSIDKNKQIANMITTELFFSEQPFDPWIPEYSLNCYKIKYDTINNSMFESFSYDQLKLLYVCMQSDSKMLYIGKSRNPEKCLVDELFGMIVAKYYITSITKYYFSVVYYAIGYKLCKALFNILEKNSEYKFKYIGFGKTLLSINSFNTFNYTDDDNDFIVTSEVLDQQQFYLFIINKLFMYNVQIYVYISEKGSGYTEIKDFITINLFPCSKKFNQHCRYTKTCFTVNDLKMLLKNGYEIKLINFSPTYELVEELYESYYGTKFFPKKMYQYNKFIKIPWIDIFYGTIKNKMLSIDSIKKLNLPVGNLKKQKLYDITVYEPENIFNFIKQLYKDRYINDIRSNKYKPTLYSNLNEYIKYNYYDNYFIREVHGKNKNNILFRFDVKDPVQKSVLEKVNELMTELVTDYSKNNLQGLI